MKQLLTPIVVDLDDTLARTDFFYESLLKFIKQNPFNLLRAIFIVFTRGKAFLKSRIGEAVNIDASLIPYNDELIEWLKEKKELGHNVILATATHEKFALEVGNHLGIFDQVLATNEEINLKGTNKQKQLVKLFGENKFIYVGDSYADLKVWRSAKSAVVMNPSEKLLRQVQATIQVEKVFSRQKEIKHFFKAIRLHQWVKNLLLLVPLFTSHNLGDYALLGKAVVAFFAFSFCASSVYIINDFFDLEDDRQHKTKCKRPFAAGQISIVKGAMIGAGCLFLSLILSLYLGAEFLLILMIYFFITLLYSLFLKFKAMLDIVVLAGLYTLRIIAGAVAIEVELSSWLLAFSMFIFLSLAIIKRYTELHGLKRQGNDGSVKSRGYLIADMDMLAVIGSASGYISVLIMALFINSQTKLNFYSNPNLLWWVCPLLLFWIGRIWLFAGRGEIHDDPIYYVIQDKTSWLLGLIIIALFMFASN